MTIRLLLAAAADDIAERIRMSYELQRAGEFEPGYGSKEGTLNF